MVRISVWYGAAREIYTTFSITMMPGIGMFLAFPDINCLHDSAPWKEHSPEEIIGSGVSTECIL